MRQSLAVIVVLAATVYASSECPPKGIHNIPHEKDCGLYYECKDGAKTEMECPGGLSFDPVISICGWPPRSECAYVALPDQECPPAHSHLAKRIPHDCSCVKYYECIAGKKVIQHCNDGTKFDFVREVCDLPENVECYKHPDEYTPMADEQNSCPAIGFTRIPHESDCNKYYACENGKKYPRSCLKGHYYNDLIKACDLPHNVICNNQYMTTTPRIIDADECPACNCDNCYTRYPHNDCSLYYECDNGTKTVRKCPEGLHFNPVTQICDWPDNVNCTIVPPCTLGNRTHHECRCNKYYECREEGWVSETCNDGEEFDYELLECLPDEEARCWPPVKPPAGCMGSCLRNESKIVVHENCTQYCECDHGKMTVVDCYKNMYFNPDKRKCDWPENIRNLTCIPFPCPPDTNTTVPHECTCDLYYECREGIHIRRECNSSMEYNYELGGCFEHESAHCYKEVVEETIIESESCFGTCPKTEPSDRSFVLPHKNCTKFCRCGVGAPYIVHCNPGLHFNSQKGICVEPPLAGCNRKYMYGFDQRDSEEHSTWHNILPFYTQE